MAQVPAAPAPVTPAPSKYPAEVEALYMARFNNTATNGIGGLGEYDPLEDIVGAPSQRLPGASSSAISDAALAAAEAYAAANNSSAFMVIHKGKLIR